MPTSLDLKTMVSFNELLMSQVILQEAIIRLLVKKGIFAKKEFLYMTTEIYAQQPGGGDFSRPWEG